MIHYKNLLTLNLKNEIERNKGKSILKSPRKHQNEAHQKMSKFYLKDNNKAGILAMPTGSGKTYTAVYWLLKRIISKNKKVLWFADQGFLLEQAREEFRENILEVDSHHREEINIRLVSGSDKHANANQIEISDDILFITSQTAISHWNDPAETRFKKFVNTNGEDIFIVYDEAHHTPAFGRRNLLIGGSEGKTGIIEKYPNINILGLTATPTYTDSKKRGWLWKIFEGGIIFQKSKKELEDAEVLAHPNFIPKKTNFNAILSDSDVDKLVYKHQDLPSHIIEELAKNIERNNYIAQYYVDNKAKFGKTIIFLDRWYQCKEVEKYINKKAGKEIALSVFSYVDGNRDADYINSRTSNQNEINLQRFRNGEIQVLLNIKMLTEGVDVPDVKSVFVTRDTNSTILFTQMIGRALRGKKAGGNKSTANIVLFSDNWNRHVQFASSRLRGGLEENSIKERGYKPYELISIDLLDKLELEYQNQNYEKSIIDFIPVGWYVVNYTDVVSDETDEYAEHNAEAFIENVIILDEEEGIFGRFINEYKSQHLHTIWEKEELDLENAEAKIQSFLIANDFESNKATLYKLIQVARHMGQDINNEAPKFYTFTQKEDVDLMKHVRLIREKDYGRNQTEDYLENIYSSNENPFFKVLFSDFESFYKAYEYEDNVYRRLKKGGVNISEADQNFTSNRLVESEVRRQVFSRDEYRCLCCGKSNNLQIDHIIAYKHEEPKDDNPNLYQTLCSICNREKYSYSYDYRFNNYKEENMAIADVLTSKSNENPKYFFTRLVNCYYKTDAVQKDSVEAKNHGGSVWKLNIKLGGRSSETIMNHKEEIINNIRSRGFRLKDILITDK